MQFLESRYSAHLRDQPRRTQIIGMQKILVVQQIGDPVHVGVQHCRLALLIGGGERCLPPLEEGLIDLHIYPHAASDQDAWQEQEPQPAPERLWGPQDISYCPLLLWCGRF
jgi:hypothetical protein